MLIRLSTLLCVGLYGGMLVFGTDTPDTTAVAQPSQQSSDPVSGRSAFSPSTAPMFFKASYTPAVSPALNLHEVVPTLASASVEAPVADRPAEEPSGLLKIGTLDAPAHVLKDKGIDVVEVTGSVVNLRAGPSTRDEVVGKLRLGVRAELIAETDDGWMKIRDLDSGAEGFMSGDFLARVTPG